MGITSSLDTSDRHGANDRRRRRRRSSSGDRQGGKRQGERVVVVVEEKRWSVLAEDLMLGMQKKKWPLYQGMCTTKTMIAR